MPVYTPDRRVGARATRSTTQVISNTTVTDITLTTETEDSNGWFAPTSATFTVPADEPPGLAACTARVDVTGTAATRRFIQIAHSATGNYRFDFDLDSSVAACVVVPYTAGETFKVQIYQATGGDVDLTNAEVSVYRVGP
jgi:hypothetical protein